MTKKIGCSYIRSIWPLASFPMTEIGFDLGSSYLISLNVTAEVLLNTCLRIPCQPVKNQGDIFTMLFLDTNSRL